MTRINTNVASLRGLRNLQRSNSLLDTSLTRLSTGLKINTGKDNPAGLIASETLRSQIATIEQSVKNSNRASNVISTADSALGEISGLLNQVRGLVQEGLNDGALSTEEIEANQLQIDAALSAINKIAANTNFAGDKLIDGSKAFQFNQTTADAAKVDDLQVNSAIFASSSTIVVDADIETAATKGELFYDFVSGGLAGATTLEIGGAKGSDVLFFGASSSIDNIASAVNSLTDTTGVVASKTDAVYGSKTVASVGSNNDLVFTDVRTSNGDNAESITQELKIAFVHSASSTKAVASSSTSSELLLTVTLDATAGNAISSTADDIASLLESSAVSSDFVSATFEGTGAATVAPALGTVSITSGAQDAFLTFRSQNFGSDQFVSVRALNGTFETRLSSVGGTLSERDAGTDIGVRINGQQAQGKGLRASVSNAQLDLSIAFNESANGVSNNSASVTITGGGSLFQIGQEVSTAGQVSLGIEAVNTATLGGIGGKLYEIGSGAGKSLLDVGPATPGSQLVDIIEQSITRVSTLRGRLGAIQKNVIETNIATLGVALENISDARSQIVDTDFAEETANLTKAQILSQAGLSVLGIANQNPSQVLSLLG